MGEISTLFPNHTVSSVKAGPTLLPTLKRAPINFDLSFIYGNRISLSHIPKLTSKNIHLDIHGPGTTSYSNKLK